MIYTKKMHYARELMFVFKKKMLSTRIQITRNSILLISIKLQGRVLYSLNMAYIFRKGILHMHRLLNINKISWSLMDIIYDR